MTFNFQKVKIRISSTSLHLVLVRFFYFLYFEFFFCILEKWVFLFLGYRNGNCGRGSVFMWIFILFPDQFFCFVADWPPRLLFFIFWFQNAQKLWSNSLSSSSVPQRKHDSVSKSVSFDWKSCFFLIRGTHVSEFGICDWWFLAQTVVQMKGIKYHAK